MSRHTLFRDLDRFGDRTAVFGDDGGATTYAWLLAAADRLGGQIAGRDLVLTVCRNEPECIVGYLGFLRAGAAVLLLHHSVSAEHLRSVLQRFRPGHVYAPAGWDGIEGAEVDRLGGYVLARCGDPSPLHDDLCVLLTTSGTTGGRSFVRLSYANVTGNAAAIGEYLRIGPDDRAITTMPLSYSYGLSILNTHLLAGAALIATEASLVTPRFWEVLRHRRATSFGGVPFVYEALERLRFARMDLPSLRVLTQAGGRLAPDLIRHFVDVCRRKDMRFIVMYGQTEATARISYVPWERAWDKAGSIGVAIPGGALSLCDDDGRPVEGSDAPGELVYRGVNVSMGYAQGAEDLTRGDDNCGVLRTGDLAVRDQDGFFTIVGRKKRFLKIFGTRVGLDEVEALLGQAGFECACAGRDDRMDVFVVGAAAVDQARACLREETGISGRGIRMIAVAALPRAESGKIDYAALMRAADDA